jgi:cyclohexyl-isocyanide hydratase
MTGPAQVLSRMPGASLDYVWKRIEPVMSDCRLALMPTLTLEDSGQFDLVCVPGGYGCTAMMADAEVLDWLRRQAGAAQLMTSVCTGSLVLAAAGLLEGYRAGCHWAWAAHLERFGAQYEPERTVIDRDRITAGGVTSGIDFAFRVIAELHGRDAAESIQLALEYDPAPLGGGTPATARPEILAAVKELMASRMASRVDEIEAVTAQYREGAAAAG